MEQQLLYLFDLYHIFLNFFLSVKGKARKYFDGKNLFRIEKDFCNNHNNDDKKNFGTHLQKPKMHVSQYNTRENKCRKTHFTEHFSFAFSFGFERQ